MVGMAIIMTVITRFAPSPTGYLHIGGARTALFNWLYSRHFGGKFYLRIEDTDRERSTQGAVDAILDGLAWLGLDWDDEPIFQFARADRHREVVEQLLAEGKAYRCYASQEELEAMRNAAMAEKRPLRYDGRWRDRDASEAPPGVKPVIRIKAPTEGSLTVKDHVRGEVTVNATELDDMVLLRSDGTPTYMLAVVVDDHDMAITHVIRGDDHFTNTFRQLMIYNAMGWNVPEFAHIPLIHGPDGAKLSKRHGALGAEAYRDMGYLPEALRNYLLRLGWSHGDEEIISTEQAKEWFDLGAVGQSPARFDLTKLDHLNGHYIREADDARLVELVAPRLGAMLNISLTDTQKSLLLRAMSGLKPRAKTLNELAEAAQFYFHTVPLNERAAKQLAEGGKELLSQMKPELEVQGHEQWNHDGLEAWAKAFGEKSGIKLGKVMGPLRAAITGSDASPSMFEVMEILGKEESLARIAKVA